MTTTHVGKIGRLSKSLRDEIGRRIEDGKPGTEIVAWLNGNPHVLELLKEHFDGRPITEQNLSEWKRTGHLEWLRREATRLFTTRLTEQTDDLAAAADEHLISDRFASVFATELAELAMTLLEKETDPEKRWQRLCGVHQQLSQLRKDDHRAVRTAIRREQWDHAQECAEDEEHQRQEQADKQRLRDIVFAPLNNQNLAEVFGGGAHGNQMAELLHRIKFDLPLDDLLVKPSPESSGPPPAGENLNKTAKIQANPT